MALKEPKVLMNGEEGFSLESISVATPDAFQRLLWSSAKSALSKWMNRKFTTPIEAGY